jgi:hypothetical protein
MAPPLKKKSDAAATVVPAWHPDLRILSSLPDTKVVRTAFFVNGAALLVAFVLTLYLGVEEWKLHEVNKQIEDWQRQIDRDTKQSAEAVLLYQDFKAEEDKTAEVTDFVSSKPKLSSIILRLAAITPVRIAFDSLDFRDTGFNIRATIKGAPDPAAAYASAYLKQLRTDKVLGPMFHEVDLLTLNKNPVSGRMVMEILCAYKKGIKKP